MGSPCSQSSHPHPVKAVTHSSCMHGFFENMWQSGIDASNMSLVIRVPACLLPVDSGEWRVEDGGWEVGNLVPHWV